MDLKIKCMTFLFSVYSPVIIWLFSSLKCNLKMSHLHENLSNVLVMALRLERDVKEKHLVVLQRWWIFEKSKHSLWKPEMRATLTSTGVRKEPEYVVYSFQWHPMLSLVDINTEPRGSDEGASWLNKYLWSDIWVEMSLPNINTYSEKINRMSFKMPPEERCCGRRPQQNQTWAVNRVQK